MLKSFHLLLFCFLALLISCSTMRLRVSGPVEKNGVQVGKLTVEKSYSTLGHAIACGVTGLFYGGWCWSYAGMPFPWQRTRLSNDVATDPEARARGLNLVQDQAEVEFVSWGNESEQWEFQTAGSNSTTVKGDKGFVLAKVPQAFEAGDLFAPKTALATCQASDEWIRNEGRSQAGGWISFTGKGVSKGIHEAYLMAEGLALERMIQECKIPHREARFFERCNKVESGEIIAYARLSIKDNFCREGLYSKNIEKKELTHEVLDERYREYQKIVAKHI